MNEGDVVIVEGKMDTRVREKTEGRAGTIIQIVGKEAWILFPDGDIWIGPMHQIYIDQSTLTPA